MSASHALVGLINAGFSPMDWNHLADPIGNEIRLRGELDEAQRIGFLETANCCPVHGTLGSEIKLQTTEAKGALIA